MAERDTFATAIKMAESGSSEGNYTQIKGLVRDGRIVGAYGFPSDQWRELAADVGLEGARWSDPKVQDIVARRTFDLLYRKYGDWRLVAVAWKAGEEVADAVAAEPRLLDDDSLKPVKDYVRQVMGFARKDIEVHSPVGPDGQPIDQRRFQPSMRGLGSESVTAPTQKSAEEALRGVLRGMRDRVRAQTPAQPEETAEALPEEEPDRNLSDRIKGVFGA